jgi:hypothetical protein
MIQLMHVLATSKHNKKEGNLNKGLLIQKWESVQWALRGVKRKNIAYFVTSTKLKNRSKTPSIRKWEAEKINGRLTFKCMTENLDN